VFGDFDEREVVGDLDRAKALRCNARFAGDRADEIRRPDSGLSTRADEQANIVSIRVAPSAAVEADLLRLARALRRAAFSGNWNVQQ